MVNTPCTIKNITLTEIGGGVRYRGAIDKEGMALLGAQLIADDSPDQRSYFCSNCMTAFDGSETFDVVKKHFGTFPS